MLEEQKAVVIGGTSGIGLAAAIELRRGGAEVLVSGRTRDKATPLRRRSAIEPPGMP